MSTAADIMFSGGTVVTMNENFEIFSDGAVVVRDNQILAVGNMAEIAERL